MGVFQRVTGSDGVLNFVILRFRLPVSIQKTISEYSDFYRLLRFRIGHHQLEYNTVNY